ncbi:MAG: DUF3857 domain-containing protein [Candidatus Omnitrophica bacterium]|nr:DUF3857 domain-containing protein [Candidatus Omnitrophota bacterium]MDD5351667.1 DUF3857 domain-containing protein [Candidatus Omnitrophota bacterium]MDD5550877.1 DUF3857 domain-containing protein [Candidatus Omnitrophota bacterium]
MKNKLCLIWIVLFVLGCGRLPQDKQARLKQADVYAAQGHKYIARSIELYKGLIKEETSANLRDGLKLKLGDLYSEMGRYAEAVDCFSGIESPEAKKKLAIAYFKNSQLTDALAQFDRLGKLNDNDYLYYYGQTLEKNNLYDKALEIYSLIPKIDKNYAKVKSRINAINLSEDISPLKNLSESIIKNAPNQQDYPEAGAVILLSEEDFEAFENNTAQYDTHIVAKIFNERGKQEFSEIQIPYDSTFEEVKLDFARTIKPDGTAVYVGDKNIRDVSMYLNYPLYSNARVRIISMPEVTEGAIIEYRAKVFQKQLVNKKDFVLNYAAQENEPVKISKLNIKIPQDKNFNYKVINLEYNKFSAVLNPKISIVDNKKVFSWQIENIPEILPEPDMSPASRINPIIMMSTFEKWDDVYKWWYALYRDKIGIDKDIQNKINELIKNKTTLKDKMRAIYNFCAKDIRYVAVEYGQAGYEPHQAKDIFKNKYGDCKDQAILLVAMLRSIGINAYPVLIGTYDTINLDRDFPSINFDHCIAAADFEGERIFMDPTGETVSFGDLPAMDQDRLIFAVLDDGYKIISTPTFGAQQNYSQIKMQITINEDDSIYARRQADTKGFFQQGQRYWIQFTKPKLIEETLKSTANAIAPGARLIKYNIENADDLDKDIVLEYEFQAPEFLAKADGSRLLPQLGGIDISSVGKEERNYPIEYSTLFETTVITEIKLPKNLKLKYLPQNLKIDSEWFEFENSYTEKNRLITFFERYRLKKKLITQDEYKEYKGLLEDIARKVNQNIILQEK